MIKQVFMKFSRRTWMIVGSGLILIILLGIFLRPGGEEVVEFQTVPVERGTLVASVGATGSVRARQSAALIWQTNGIVDAVNVSVGGSVSQGELLASLARTSLNQSIILAEADLVSAEKALEDLLTSDTARLEAEKAADEAEKAYEKAYNWRMTLNGKVEITDYFYEFGVLKSRQYKGYASEETIEQADKDLALAESRLEDARRSYDRLVSGPDSADVAAAKARVAAAKSTLNLAYLIAPFDGTITQANPAVGDQVSAGVSGFRIDDLSRLLVDVQVSEVDINSVEIDQTAVLTFDAVLGQEYHGKVVQVGQAGDTVQGVVSFTVTIELTDSDENVKPGMTAAVSLVVEEVTGVMLVPNRAVRLVDGDRVVYILVDGQPEPVKIQLGASSDVESAVADGDLEEGDLIILNPPSSNGSPFGG